MLKMIFLFNIKPYFGINNPNKVSNFFFVTVERYTSDKNSQDANLLEPIRLEMKFSLVRGIFFQAFGIAWRVQECEQAWVTDDASQQIAKMFAVIYYALYNKAIDFYCLA